MDKDDLQYFSRLHPPIEPRNKYGDFDDLSDEETGDIARRLFGGRSKRNHQAKQELGAEIARYDDELKRIVRAAQGKRRYDEHAARKQFPEFTIWAAIDNSRLSAGSRKDLFSNVFHSFGTQDGRFLLIGELKGIASSTAYDYYKARPHSQRRIRVAKHS